MCKFLYTIMAVILLSSCGSKNENTAAKSGQEIYFESTTYDYGQIMEDSDGLYTISFKNIGKKPILVNRVRSTCGCTVPSWPKEPLEPGESGEIKVKYNTALPGSFMKSVYVYSTAANSPVKLVVKGKVLPKEKS
jgi:hypothetical protein